MELKHTKGEWHAILSSEGSFDIGTSSNRNSANILCSRYAWKECAEEMHANAHLMAAAPDLLAALELLMAEVEASGNADSKGYGWPEAVRLTRAAIAKATGTAP